MKALLLNVGNTYVGARTPAALHKAGFNTVLVAPPNSIFHQSSYFTKRCVLELRKQRGQTYLSPERVIQAIIDWEPDIIIPNDLVAHRMLTQLVEKFSKEHHKLVQKIIQSLGPIAIQRPSPTRSHLSDAIQILGLNDLEQQFTPTADSAIAFSKTVGWPIILKNGYSENGSGVQQCRSAKEVEAYFNPIQQKNRGLIMAQRFVKGKVIKHSIAALNGEVVASNSGIQLHTRNNNPFQTVTAVELTHQPKIEEAVSKLSKYWNLTGISGFDFLYDPNSDLYFLIDFNERITSMTNIGSLFGKCQFSALHDALCGKQSPPSKNEIPKKTLITIFPYELLRDPESPLLESCASDAPIDDPSLLKAYLEKFKIQYSIKQ